MSKGQSSLERKAEVNSEPAQPLLPRVNLARFLLRATSRCDCDSVNCKSCPPWSHSIVECGACGDVPPVCNTGAHESSNRGSGR